MILSFFSELGKASLAEIPSHPPGSTRMTIYQGKPELQGVGNIMQTRTDEGHFVKLHGPITLRTLRFKLTDVDGNVVNTRGTSVSFAIFLDYDQ